jgi:DNA-binding NarL/FixJ family response regulator
MTAEQPGHSPPRLVRVGIVDDSEQIRRLLHLFFGTDDRFEIVGEATNGDDAVTLAATQAPDLLILDQQMPGRSGVEALPDILRQSPGTAVVLYTGEADPRLSGRALAAGALAVLDKVAAGPSIVDRLSDILLGHWAGPEADVELRLGPVDAAAARVWIANTLAIVAALRRHPDVLAEPVPEDVLDVFDQFLATWQALAAATEEFYWAARAEISVVERLVDWWATIDRMSDDKLAALGVQWSPPEGDPFFRALTAAVIDAVSSHREMQTLAAVLAGQWKDAGDS